MHVFNIYEPALPLIPRTTKENKTNKINSDFRSISPTPSSQFSHAWIKHQLQSLFEGKNCLHSKHVQTFPLLFPKQYSIMIIHIVFLCYKVTQVICNFLKYTTGISILYVDIIPFYIKDFPCLWILIAFQYMQCLLESVLCKYRRTVVYLQNYYGIRQVYYILYYSKKP